MFASDQLIVALVPGTPIHCSVAADPEYAAKADSASTVAALALVINLAIWDSSFMIVAWFGV